MNYKELKQNELKPLRYKMWILNNKKCPVLDKEISFEKSVIDHAHKRNDEEYSPTKGVIRECLDFRVNSVLGKLENSLKRSGLLYLEDFNISTFLRNAADYFEKGAYIDEDGDMLIHPKEVKKLPKLSKRNYNRCKNLYNKEIFIPKRKNQKKKVFPDYPKSGKPTKKLVELFKKFNVELYN